MTTPTAGPRCPRCHRPLAAWRLDHCVYCGEVFPAELKAGFAEPEGVKWIERPPLPPDVSKKLELIRVVPTGPPKKSRPFMLIAGAVAVPFFGALFYIAYKLVSQLSPGSSLLILVAGLGVIGYLGYIFFRDKK